MSTLGFRSESKARTTFYIVTPHNMKALLSSFYKPISSPDSKVATTFI